MKKWYVIWRYFASATKLKIIIAKKHTNQRDENNDNRSSGNKFKRNFPSNDTGTNISKYDDFHIRAEKDKEGVIWSQKIDDKGWDGGNHYQWIGG